LLLAAVLLFGFLSRAAEPIEFAGAPAELTISEISERTLQISLSPLDEQGHPQAPQPSSILVSFPVKEKLRIRDLSSLKDIDTGHLQVTMQARPLRITVRGQEPERKIVQELTFADGTNAAIVFRTPSPVFGLGEGEHQFDRRGAKYSMVNGQFMPLLATHGATIPVPFLIGADGWALFFNGLWGEFDLSNIDGKFLPGEAGRGKQPLEIFVINASEPADAMAEYIRLTGHPVMPPKWALGYFQSHRTLAGPNEPVQIAQTFREKKLPCDALIYLGTGYCTNGWNTGHGSLEFNTNAFEHPALEIQALHNLNFKAIFHINHAPKNLFGASVQEDSDSPLHIHNYWARHKADFALGVDGWWPDDGDELPIEARLTRHRCYYEGPLLDRPNVRPWSLHRNGYACAARFGGWIWSGDTQSRWSTLAAHVPVGLNHSVSLTPFWGTDIGGFVATKELTGELYARWFQFAAFNPLFRSHGRTWHLRLPWGWDTGDFGPIETPGKPDPSELHNTAVEGICRKYLELRYRLLPYNYTLIREACDTGMPPMRALWLHYPNDAEAVKLGDEYLWGRDLLVAPVVEKEAKTRRVYLPPGEWYDWWTNSKVASNHDSSTNGLAKGWIERPVDLATMPIYVRAGAVIPLDPVRQFTAEHVSAPTTLNVYPGADSSLTLYDDDGSSLGYLHGQGTWTQFRWDDRTHTLTIELDPRSKSKTEPRRFDVVLVTSGERKLVDYSGGRSQVKF
jgi:alpha-glucosidase/alpha-D-xyloside xylohydrolase